jgi:hypothetical protein
MVESMERSDERGLRGEKLCALKTQAKFSYIEPNKATTKKMLDLDSTGNNFTVLIVFVLENNY